MEERPANTAETEGLRDALVVDLGSGVTLTLCYIPPGNFIMGSPATEEARFDVEDQVKVRLSQGFWLAQTECTQAQWRLVMGTNPSHFKGDNLPVEQVSWEEAYAFVIKLNDMDVLTAGWKWSLPTEAQWEYACLAGTTGPYAGELNQMAWYGHNSCSKTHPVGTKAANAWGLHDMHGNVAEWCADAWDGSRKLAGGTDPVGMDSSSRAFRGGSWSFLESGCRSAYRNWNLPGLHSYLLGFRPAVVPSTMR
jgi:formylglycine-generating enzyme required for sulfatase activity